MQVKLVLLFSLLAFTLAYRPRPQVHPRSKVTQLEIEFEGSALHKHTAFLPLSCIPKCDDGNEPMVFMTYDDKCPKILTQKSKEESEITVEDYCQFSSDQFGQVDNFNNVCQYCRSEANHQWHRFQAQYIGIKHFIYPASDHCSLDEDFHLKVMKEGKCEDLIEDRIGMHRASNNRAKMRELSRERRRA